MFDTNGIEYLAVVLAISLVVFFGLMDWVHLANESVVAPSWRRTAIGVSALVIAFCALLALF